MVDTGRQRRYQKQRGALEKALSKVTFLVADSSNVFQLEIVAFLQQRLLTDAAV